MRIAELWAREGVASVSRRLNRQGRWTVAPYRDADEADALALFAAVYGQQISPEEWRWKYRQNPDGEALMLTARQSGSGRLVAFHAALPLETNVGDDRLACFSVVDSMVDPAFRYRGLYIDLSIRLFDQIFLTDGAVVMGLPNAQAYPVNNALGMPTIDHARLYAAPLNAANLIRGRLGSRTLEAAAGAAGAVFTRPLRNRLRRPMDAAVREVDAFPAGIEAFCRRALSGYGVASRRTAARQAWRFRKRPGRAYRILQHGDGANLAGFAVITVLEKGDLRVGAVADFVHDAARTDGTPLLHAALKSLHDDRADVAVALTMSRAPDQRIFQRAGFYSSRLLWTGRPFHFLIEHRPRTMSERQQRHHDLLTRASSWFFTLGDTDLV